MRFAIRDDDTNYFTSPAELQSCYGDIWNEIPVTLCIISKVKGDWKKWVHQIYKTKHTTDWNAWAADDTVYPIEHNNELLQFLKEKIARGKLDIGFHAKHHRNADEQLPGQRNNNYIRGAEFFTNRDQTRTIREEVDHLNRVFGGNISVFTPPQNLLSKTGYHSVIKAGLNICGGGIPFYKKERSYRGMINLFKQLAFKLRYPGYDYPYVLKFAAHTEIVYHYPLQPSTSLDSLVTAFNKVKKFNGDFVLSTHYIEFDYPMEYDANKTMKMVLHEFIEYAKSQNNVRFVTLSAMLKR